MISDAQTSMWLQHSELTFNCFFDASTCLAQIQSVEEVGGGWLNLAYYLKLWSFLLGLGLIVTGTGLIKPTVSSIINGLYGREDARRPEAFTLFMVFIYLGSFSANFIAGTLGEKLGWHYGFMAAALGMILGVGVYILKQEKYLGDVGIQPSGKAVAGAGPLSVEEKKRIRLLLIMGAFTILYAVSFYQKGGLLNLYTRENIDMYFWGFEVPVTWLLAISTGVFVIAAPLFSRFWRYLFLQGMNVTGLHKLALGLFIMAIAYLFLIAADLTRDLAGDGKSHVMWIVATYIFFGIGDVMIWPPQIAAAASLSPARYTSFAVGAWYLTIGIGSWLTGYVGALSYSIGSTILFASISLVCAVCAGLVLLGYRRFHNMACGSTY